MSNFNEILICKVNPFQMANQMPLWEIHIPRLCIVWLFMLQSTIVKIECFDEGFLVLKEILLTLRMCSQNSLAVPGVSGFLG